MLEMVDFLIIFLSMFLAQTLGLLTVFYFMYGGVKKLVTNEVPHYIADIGKIVHNMNQGAIMRAGKAAKATPTAKPAATEADAIITQLLGPEAGAFISMVPADMKEWIATNAKAHPEIAKQIVAKFLNRQNNTVPTVGSAPAVADQYQPEPPPA
ncbi:MAG: hypothetical protein ACYTBZ_24370 [Planctomycetota bacterium]|jgi:hypothetical protein